MRGLRGDKVLLLARLNLSENQLHFLVQTKEELDIDKCRLVALHPSQQNFRPIGKLMVENGTVGYLLLLVTIVTRLI